jgi:shikimate kinase
LKAQREETYRKAHLILDAAQPKEKVVAEVLSLLETTVNQ